MNVLRASETDRDLKPKISAVFVDGFYQWLRYFSKPLFLQINFYKGVTFEELMERYGETEIVEVVYNDYSASGGTGDYGYHLFYQNRGQSNNRQRW